jgi:tRNA A-37 threonylcarbamoyl transferase component Bud32
LKSDAKVDWPATGDSRAVAQLIEAAFAEEFPDASHVRVDQLRTAAMAADPGLMRLRVRWRERGAPRSQLLAMRRPAQPAEAEALRTAERIGLPAPRLWLGIADGLLFEWIEGRTFGSLYRARSHGVTAEVLADLLAQLHVEGGGLCHGDYGPSSVLLDARGRPTIVNWSHAHRGDRNRDVAVAVRNVEAEAGAVLRAPFLRAYRRIRPIAPEELDEAT